MAAFPAIHGVLDAEQSRCAARLSLLTHRDTDAPFRGVYVHGSVGRGKTWLCDAFFDAWPGTAKRRVHFHDFFRRLHETIWLYRTHPIEEPVEFDTPSTPDPDPVGQAIADLYDGVELLYFDEFYVHDTADAVLLTQVLQAAIDSGITLVATSNYAPSDLLPSPDFHHMMEPAIALIEAHFDVVELGGDHDYRLTDGTSRAAGFAAGRWIAASPAGLLDEAGLVEPAESERTSLDSRGHRFNARRASGGELWFDFADLCEAHTSVNDYLAWSAESDVWVLDAVPKLATTTPSSSQRFAHLIDVLCDADVTLHIRSNHTVDEVLAPEPVSPHLAPREIPPPALGPLDLVRTASRLALLRPLR
ncbi:cell division protein ZapE [Glaciibacter psychrotolerans]|uniref:Cell division protein ZapE n=1 Tax=Glaciibacter psychrotolerans TaxID=670054 RepID=A0A7Z0J5Q1_9MICO|nr:cell division protein ZapE [Leifsonia psychrotolerans]NYJ19717.1 cell division protein ZapE [Leifsonia psychrotolerans]